ncbi:MAG TPA: hypothetical protein VFX59_12990 [Polyangiales bacterium]|nr:hypothetical protein [Polyangiales bacterium]
MSSSPSQRMNRSLLLIAASVTCVAFALWGAQRGTAAAIGAGLSLINWFALRWLVSRMFEGGNKAALGLCLMAKIGALIGVVYFLISRVQLDPLGLAFGLGVLFVGPAVAGLLVSNSSRAASGRSTASGSLNPSAAASAREER